eukprot:scaffold62682_cov17-Tisochrysis_lutea.AAC.1
MRDSCSSSCSSIGATLSSLLPAVLSSLSFCLASSALILLNKYILSSLGFGLPLTLSLLGMGASFALALGATVITRVVPRTVELDLKFCVRRAMP